MRKREELLAAAQRVDVFATADRVIEQADPFIPSVTTAEAFALAAGVAELANIMLQTKLLVQVLRRPAGMSAAEQERHRGRVESQLAHVEQLLGALNHTPPANPEGASL